MEGIDCFGGLSLFSSLDLSQRKTLLQRLCLSSMQFLGASESICQNHIRNLLGVPFGKAADRNCFWPDHLVNRGTHKSKLRFLSLEVSMSLRAHANIYVPFRTGLCDNCRRWKFEPIMEKLRQEGFPPILQDDSNEYVFSASEKSDTSGRSSTISRDLSDLSIGQDDVIDDPNFNLPEKDLFEEKRKILNALLKINGSDTVCKTSIQTSYFKQKQPKQSEFRYVQIV